MTVDLQPSGDGPGIEPLEAVGADDGSGQLAELCKFLGYTPNALATMARRPGVLSAILALVDAVLAADGQLSKEQRYLLACEAARHGASKYTATHLVHAAHHVGATWHRIESLAFAHRDGEFSEAELSLIDLAGPPSKGEELRLRWEKARHHWNPDALAEAVAVIALVAWFCRWNGLVNTSLEAEPAAVIDQVAWLRNE